MRRILAILALLLASAACTALAAERTVFVNPGAGRLYHMARHCPAGGEPDKMVEFSAAQFALSEYAGYRRCERCFGVGENLGAPLSFGQLGAQGLHYPLWQPEDSQEPWAERVAAVLSADLNHDGIPDRIEVSIAPDEEGKSAAELVDGLSLGFIKVFPGKPDGGFHESPAFVSRGVNGAHVANGTLMLVRRDGQDYLLYCSFYGIMGEADYAYTVFWLQDGMGVTVEDRRFASFALPGGEPANLPGRDEVLPAYREAMENWTAEAKLLLSAHAELGTEAAEGESAPDAADFLTEAWALYGEP